MTTAATMTVSRLGIEFDALPCSKCNGSGIFIAHIRQGTGTVCFRCLGQRGTMTPAAKRAAARLDAWVAESLMVPAESLTVGDRFRSSRLDTYRTVEAIEWAPKFGRIVDGVCGGSWAIRTSTGTVHISAGDKVQRSPVAGEMSAVAATLGKGARYRAA